MPSLRDQFPLLKNRSLIYLDSAATAQKPECVIEAMNDFYRNSYGTVHRALYSLSEEATALYENARSKIARTLSVKSNEIIFTRGTTESLNFLSRTLPLRAGDEILISEAEHHANLVPWQMVAKEKNLKLLIAPILADGSIDLAALKNLLSSRTKVVALAHVSNVLGVINPIQEIAKLAHANGSLFVVDGAQAAPHLPLNLSELDVDFYTISGHKLYGPTGIGILFGKEHLLNQLPPPQGGGDMIENVTLEETTYKNAPLRFEAGTPPIAEAIGMEAAIDFFTTHFSFKQEEALYQLLRSELLSQPGLTLLGDHPKKAPLATFTIEGIHPLDVATLLNLKGICMRSGHLCAQPLLRKFGHTSALRASIGIYTTEEDILAFSDALKSILSQLKPSGNFRQPV